MLAEGWKKLGEARQLIEDDPDAGPKAAELVQSAYTSALSIVFSFQWAEAGRPDEATEVLERALACSSRQDWEYRMRSRSLLAELYARGGRNLEAAEQYRIVLDNS